MCGMVKCRRERASVPVTPRLREAVQRERMRRLEYEAHAQAGQDPEHQAVVRALAHLAHEDGVI
jgi:RNase P protein component